jgi:hypothetical protein
LRQRAHEEISQRAALFTAEDVPGADVTFFAVAPQSPIAAGAVVGAAVGWPHRDGYCRRWLVPQSRR